MLICYIVKCQNINPNQGGWYIDCRDCIKNKKNNIKSDQSKI